ncbi:molybdopterin synthase catalytic subunit MoaE [Pseudidiomarina sp. 1APR75-33.1]|uniref:molybdopterin synthase catalytic subunit MoaE n=1 Tax=Pseudidiomarina terrestris TaxID=2820060 RepID=UPI00264CD6F7|nr:molybdopterin synthase catalytic subunit MoaE [Pseudidiomarina sp. 1APR75-33.1]MDN7125795.1 molybdopterin synthase catalytic subunit MoaE [Pseudidiomarina sp. 1APR75-33.1]
MSQRIRVQTADFDVAAEYQRLAQTSSCGAVVTFSGLVRELVDGELEGLTLEHYPGMTERVLEQLVEQACKRWQLGEVTLIHRVGQLALNEQIVFVGVAAAHRKAAFAAAIFIMDFLKTQAPFWKQEHSSTGSYWVAAKATDKQAAEAWQEN